MKAARWGAIAACLLLIQPVRAEDRFAQAEASLQGGNFAAAVQVATALVRDNPDDPKALILLGRAQIASAQPQQARDTALLGWQAARGDRALSFAAARLGARAASDTRRYGAARLWLRRASDFAHDAQHRAVIAQSFAVLRRIDPSSTQLSFSVTPSSNINAGSSQDRLIVDGSPTPLFFSGDARALSGVEVRLAFGHLQRISQSAAGTTYLGFRLSGTTYMLSDAARLQAPNVAGKDFSNALAEVSLRRTRFMQTATLRYGAALGRTWRGGSPESTRFRFDAIHSRLISSTVSSDIGFVVEGRWTDRDAARSTAISVTGALDWQLGPHTARGQLTLTQVHAPDRPSDAYKSATLALSFVPAPRNRYVEPKFGVSASVYDFDTVLGNIFGNTGRTDQQITIELQLDLPRMERMGFTPNIALGATRTWSSVSRYDGKEVSAAFRLESSF